MLKLVESLAVKAERAKKTTVQFIPLRDSGSGAHKCSWCETVVRGKRKGWNSYHAIERLGPTTECVLTVMFALAKNAGSVCKPSTQPFNSGA